MSIDITINEQNVNVFDGGQKYYLSAYDTTDQANAGATSVNKMTYNVTDINNGISIVDNSKITISKAGIYNLQFSAQVFKTSGGSSKIEIWLCKNGQNVSNSGGEMLISGNSSGEIATWNYLLSASANDYYELCWSSSDTAMKLDYTAAQSNPSRPEIPSVILTVWQI